MTTTEQIKGIVERLGALRRYLDVDAKTVKFLTKKKRLCSDFWNNARGRSNCKES
jgi:peptide chain release factor 2